MDKFLVMNSTRNLIARYFIRTVISLALWILLFEGINYVVDLLKFPAKVKVYIVFAVIAGLTIWVIYSLVLLRRKHKQFLKEMQWHNYFKQK